MDGCLSLPLFIAKEKEEATSEAGDYAAAFCSLMRVARSARGEKSLTI